MTIKAYSNSRRDSSIPALLVAAACIVLTSCAKHTAKPESQLAAKVGSYEITQYQVDAAVSTIPNLQKANLTNVKNAVVQGMVDRQLLVQKAEALKMDRTPQVLTAIDSARQDIIAKAYAAQITAGISPPSDGEVKRYYEEHPDLFASRKIYTLKEIRVPTKDPAEAAALVAAASSQRSIDDVSQSLHDKRLNFTSGVVVRAAESLPLHLLPSFSQGKDGAILAFAIPGGAYVAQIVNTKPEPVDQVTATPSIRRFLITQREKIAMNEQLDELKKLEKVQYFGDYAKLANTSEDGKRGATNETLVPDVSQAGADQKP